MSMNAFDTMGGVSCLAFYVLMTSNCDPDPVPADQHEGSSWSADFWDRSIQRFCPCGAPVNGKSRAYGHDGRVEVFQLMLACVLNCLPEKYYLDLINRLMAFAGSRALAAAAASPLAPSSKPLNISSACRGCRRRRRGRRGRRQFCGHAGRAAGRARRRGGRQGHECAACVELPASSCLRMCCLWLRDDSPCTCRACAA